MIIAVDFDGTCVIHKFPDIGENIGAEIVLKKLTDDGSELLRSSSPNIMKLRTLKKN